MADSLNFDAAVDDYLAAPDKSLATPQQNLQASLVSALPANPDSLAEARKIARRTGVAVDTVLAQPEAMKTKAFLSQFDADAYAVANPKSADFLSNVDNAKIAHDDTEGLSALEKEFGRWKTPSPRAFSFGNIAENLSANFMLGIESGTSGVRAAAQGLLGNTQEAQASAYNVTQAARVAGDTRPDIESEFWSAAYGAAESTAQMLPGLTASLATGGAAGVALGVSAAGLQSGGQSFAGYLEEGVPVKDALLASAGYGGVEAATELLPMGFLVSKFGKKPLANFVGELLLREVPGEQLATLGQDAIDTAVVPGMTWEDYLKERPQAAYQTFVTTLFQSAGMAAASQVAYRGTEQYQADREEAARQRVIKQVNRAAKAEQDAARFEEIFAMSTESKVRTRDPLAFQNFIESVVSDTAVQDVFIDPKALAQSGIDIQALAQSAPSIEAQIREASATGGDIKIPVSEFATYLAGTDIGAQLIDHLKTSPSAMSRLEANEFMQSQAAELKAEVEKALTETAEQETFNASTKAVHQNIADQLREVNRFSDTVNNAYASLISSFYSVQAAKQGVTPEELFAKFPLQIQGVPVSGASFGQLPLNDKGEVVLRHWSSEKKLKSTDPKRWGQTGAALTRGERNRIGVAPGRTYFGVADQYQKENQLGEFEYETSVPASRLYDMQNDPSDLRAKGRKMIEKGEWTADGASLYEKLIQDAGYLGYHVNGPNGRVAVVFEELPVKRVKGKRYGFNTGSDRGDTTAPGSIQNNGSLRGGAELLAQSPGPYIVDGTPLTNAPGPVEVPGRGAVQFGPFPLAREAAAKYMFAAGLAYAPPTKYVKVDPERATRIAQAFDAMKHEPNDLLVRESYAAMIRETLAQFQYVKATGLQIDFIEPGMEDPYAASPRLAILDVIENNHLWVFPTDSGFGGTETASIDISGNPLLDYTDEVVNGRRLRANDVFRIVHDYFGHIKDGHGFRAEGEENAWQSHAAMYSPLARRAMTTETRGQNSWVNYGPFAAINRTATAGETQYAPQKIGLLPEWVSLEGLATGKGSGLPEAALFQSNEPELTAAMLKIYGTTKNPLEAGYISSNGEMINLRRYTDPVDHYTAAQAVVKGAAEEEAQAVFETTTGAIRVDFSSGYASLSSRPSAKALDAFARAAEKAASGENDPLTFLEVAVGQNEILEFEDDNITAKHISQQVNRALKEADNKGELYQSDVDSIPSIANLGYRSKMYDVLSQKLNGTATGNQHHEQIQALIRKGEFKNEEYFWSGLEEELKAEGDNKLSKGQVLDKIREGYSLELEEVGESAGEGAVSTDENIFSEDSFGYPESEYVGDDSDEFLLEMAQDSDVYNDILQQLKEENQDLDEEDQKSEDELVAQAEQAAIDQERKYQLDSEFNYQQVWEKLETVNGQRYYLKVTQLYDSDYEVSIDGVYVGTANDWPGVETAFRDGFSDKFGIELGNETPQFEDWTADGGTNYSFYRVRAEDLNGQEADPTQHYDDTNVLFHYRTKDRVGPNGERMLFVEEIQSDLHHKALEIRQEIGGSGYKDESYEERSAALEEELYAARLERDKAVDAQTKLLQPARDFIRDFLEALRTDSAQTIGNVYNRAMQEYEDAVKRNIPIDDTYAPNAGRAAQAALDEFKDTITAAAWRASDQAIRDADKAVSAVQSKIFQLRDLPPPAPLSKTWRDAALKRILARAQQEGYASIGMTTGDQQNARYNIGNRLTGLKALKTPEGKYSLEAPDFRVAQAIQQALGNEVTDETNTIVIRDLTEEQLAKAFGAPGAAAITSQAKENEVTNVRFDKDIRLGGEGKRKLYDEIIPKELNKILKKLDPSLKVSPVDYTISEKEGRYTFDKIWYAELTPKAKASIEQGLELFQRAENAPEPRGRFNPGTSTITLLQAADLSTFLHETGHFFLETLNKMAQLPDAPTDITSDMDTILKWFGVPDVATWNNMTLDEQRDHHEKFARGFEAYLFEGKAPSLEMRSIFQKFRAWLINVYRSITMLNVELTDEVRGVFNRLLATSEQIKETELARSFEPLFKNATEAGMTETEWREYQELGVEATLEAVDDLQARSLRDMKYASNAKGRALKALQKEVEAKRKAMRRQVTAEVNAMPVYQAMTFLKKGVDPQTGEPVEGGHKLSIPEVEAMYGETGAITSISSKLGYGRYGMLGTENAIHPDQAAEMFGFSSGDELVRALLSAEKPSERIAALTDQRMLEKYGDLTDPTALERAAEEAVHNEVRARFIATELNALQKAIGGRKILTSAARDFAENMIARLRIMEVRPSRYAAAEVRAARAAEKARATGNIPEAAVEKRNQLIQNYAAKAALNAQRETEQTLRYLNKFSNQSTRKSVDIDYLDQIDALLSRFDLRKSTSIKAIQERKSLLAWVESQKEVGLEPEIPEALLNEANRKSFKDLTVEELRGLRDTVKQIEHLGRLKNKLLTAKDKRDFGKTVSDIVGSIQDNAKGKVADNRTRAGGWGDVSRLFKGFLASHRKVSSLARELDGFKDGGQMWETFVRSMNEAGDNEASMRAKATQDVAKLITPILDGKKMGGKGTFFPSIDKSLNREERLGIALNTGNLSNLQRLLDGEGWTMEQVRPVLDTLTKEEWDFVQSVWDYFETFRPQIAAKERRVYGKEPEWIDANPVSTPYGVLRGGYYPVKYDTRRSLAAEQQSAAEQAKAQLKGAFTSATTRRSFTKTRADKVEGRPLLYSLDGLYQGINEVIHDLSWHEWLIDANRLLRSKSLDRAIRNVYGAETIKQFKTAVEDIAAGEIPAQNEWEAILGSLRAGATVAGLGFNIVNSIINVSGLSNSAVRIGPRWLALGVAKWTQNPRALVTTVNEKSEFMRLRSQTMLRELNEIRSVVRGKSSARQLVDQLLFAPLTLTQVAVDSPTWWGAYQKALAEDQTEERAIALADQAVLDSQSGGQMKDLAAIQRGGPVQKLFTTFYGYFNAVYNLTVEQTKKTNFRDPKDVIRLGGDYLMLYTIPSIFAVAIKTALMGDEDDWEPEALAKALASEQMSYMFGTMVGLREIGSAAQTVAGVNPYNIGYSGPAGTRFIQEIYKLAQQVSQGEADEALLKAMVNVAGILFKLPSSQINRTILGTYAYAEGDTENPLAVLAGPPRK